MKINLSSFPKATIILRGYTYEQVNNIIKVLSNSKVNSVEITMNTPGCKNIIEKLIDKYGGKMLIGAGTVLTKQDLLDVIKLGVKFALSPIMFPEELLQICKENDVISVPAAFTPTEIYQGFQNGADIVKVFPAGILSPKFFKDIQAPLGKLNLMAVGGVNEKNARDFITNGAEFLGIGSGIFDKEDVIQGNLEKIEARVKVLEEALNL